MEYIKNLFRQITNLSSFNQEIQCVECGKFYLPCKEKGMFNKSSEIVNICDEACFSTHMRKRKAAI